MPSFLVCRQENLLLFLSLCQALQGGTVRNHSSVERKVTIPEPFQLRSESRLRTPRDNQENGMKKDGLDNSKQNVYIYSYYDYLFISSFLSCLITSLKYQIENIYDLSKS